MKVAVYSQYYKPEDKKYIKQLLAILQQNNIACSIHKILHEGLKKEKEVEKLPIFSHHSELNSSFHFLFTIGGDGTILRASTLVRDKKIPIVGINTGRLGFLATVQKEEIEDAVKNLLCENFKIKERSLLNVTTTPKTEDLKELGFALNDVSVSRKNTASMITVKTHIDDEYLTSYWADGLIIATPTGSTGYSLSCGGPVITPTSKNFVLTPIAPHNLNARPLVIPDETKITLNVNSREKEFLLTLDSRIVSLNCNTSVIIKKTNFNLQIVEINKQTFLKTLREKLLWGQDARN